MLNRVVFPEPFGPISPAMLPRSTAIEQSLSACTPPYAFETPSVRSNAVMTRSWWSARGDSRAWSRQEKPRAAGRWPVRPPAAARGRQDPPRQEDDHDQEQRAEEDLGKVGVGHLLLRPAEPGLEQQRAEDGPG